MKAAAARLNQWDHGIMSRNQDRLFEATMGHEMNDARDLHVDTLEETLFAKTCRCLSCVVMILGPVIRPGSTSTLVEVSRVTYAC
jgi:hypothetical protein